MRFACVLRVDKYSGFAQQATADIMRLMILDAVPFLHKAQSETAQLTKQALDSFVAFIERKLDVLVVRDASRIPFGRPDLAEPLRIAQALIDAQILISVQPLARVPDEVPLRAWGGVSGDRAKRRTGGATFENDSDALYAMLAETLERYLWTEESDSLRKPVRATTEEIRTLGPHLAWDTFAAFSAEQRARNPRLSITDTTPFLWNQGESLISGESVYVPTQTISALTNHPLMNDEPFIRDRSTIGLATWPTKSGARLAGMLEIVEREAYMVMWLNQLTLPRIALGDVCARSTQLARAIERCKRYRFNVHALQMCTDAPTHAVCVVLEDLSGVAPRFSFGLKAHRSLPGAIEKAITEALRARTIVRRRPADGAAWNPNTPIAEIGHLERLFYWADGNNTAKLEFLIRGTEVHVPAATWEADSEEQHLARMVDWCKDSGFECVSVPYGTSKKNPTPWHVEMVVMPALQPTYLTERLRQFGGTRWKSLPSKFGYAARAEPFAESPHPFA